MTTLWDVSLFAARREPAIEPVSIAERAFSPPPGSPIYRVMTAAMSEFLLSRPEARFLPRLDTAIDKHATLLRAELRAACMDGALGLRVDDLADNGFPDEGAWVSLIRRARHEALLQAAGESARDLCLLAAWSNHHYTARIIAASDPPESWVRAQAAFALLRNCARLTVATDKLQRPLAKRLIALASDSDLQTRIIDTIIADTHASSLDKQLSGVLLALVHG